MVPLSPKLLGTQQGEEEAAWGGGGRCCMPPQGKGERGKAAPKAKGPGLQ